MTRVTNAMLVTVTWGAPRLVCQTVARTLGRSDPPASYVEMEAWIRSVVNDAMARIVTAPIPKPRVRHVIKKRSVK